MKLRATLTATGLLLAGAVFAHQGATGIVKDRMDTMGVISNGVKAVAPMMRGTAEINLEKIEAVMRMMAAKAEHLPMMFPEGTDHAPSEAGPAIWTDPEGFAALFVEMQIAASEMADLAASGEVDGLQEAFGKVAGTCKACHGEYRVKRD